MTFGEQINERLTALLETSGRELQLTREERRTHPSEVNRAFYDSMVPMLAELVLVAGEIATEIDALRAEIERKR